MERDGVYKVFTVKDGSDHYSVEEMPGYCGVGRDHAIKHNRIMMTERRFIKADQAKIVLLKYLLREYEQQTTIDM